MQERECCRLSTAAFPCGAITLPDAAVTPGVRWDLISVAKTFGASSCCFLTSSQFWSRKGVGHLVSRGDAVWCHEQHDDHGPGRR